jgi:hypothetical protein
VEAALRVAGRFVSGVVAELGRSGWPASLAVLLAGLVLLVVGARARRPVAVAGSAGVAAIAALWLAARLPAVKEVAPTTLAAGSAAAAAALAAVFPPIFPALAGALPVAVLVDLVSPSDRWPEAAAAGALLGAIAGLVFARTVAALVASGAGALAFAVGVAGALAGTGAGRALAAHPVAVLAVAVVLGVAGTAFQLSRAWGRGADGDSGKGTGKRVPPVKDASEAR